MMTHNQVGCLIWLWLAASIVGLCAIAAYVVGCSQQQARPTSPSTPPVPKMIANLGEPRRASWLQIVGPSEVVEGGMAQYKAYLHTPLLGDATRNGKVDLGDWVRLEANWGRTGMKWGDGDFTFDGKVDMRDYMILERNFGQEK